jgi:EmrB/QacA subfamily drug resistance transporter
MFIYAAGLLGCGLAQDVPTMTPARFLQGLGEGVVVGNVLATLWREFPQRKDLAMALYGISIYFGKVLGPSLGAFLTDYPNWHWIFLGPAPIALVSAVLAWWFLLPDKPIDVEPQPFDFPGLWLLAIWVLALVICLFRGQKWGWTTSREWCVIFVVFVLSFAGWVAREALCDGPLIELSLFRRRIFTVAMAVKSLYVINLYGVISLLCDYMVGTRQYPRTTSGLVLLPGALAMLGTLFLSGLLGKAGYRHARVTIGLAGMALMTWQMSVIDLYYDKWHLCWLFGLWGAAGGLVIGPILVMASEGLSQPEIVSSAAIKNMVRILPGTLGSLVIGTMMERRTDAYFDYLRQDIVPNRAVAENVTTGLVDHMTKMGSSGPAPHEQAAHVISAYIHSDATVYAAQTTLQWLAILTALAALVSPLLREPPPLPATPPVPQPTT